MCALLRNVCSRTLVIGVAAGVDSPVITRAQNEVAVFRVDPAVAVFN